MDFGVFGFQNNEIEILLYQNEAAEIIKLLKFKYISTIKWLKVAIIISVTFPVELIAQSPKQIGILHFYPEIF